MNLKGGMNHPEPFLRVCISSHRLANNQENPVDLDIIYIFNTPAVDGSTCFSVTHQQDVNFPVRNVPIYAHTQCHQRNVSLSCITQLA